MKFVLGVLVGLAMATAGVAGAASMRIFTIRNHDNVITADRQLFCVYTYGTTAYGTITCGKISRPNGYTVAINKYLVSISNSSGIIFSRRCC
jgi:hypothetical protein